jgi:hypothetical protein
MKSKQVISIIIKGTAVLCWGLALIHLIGLLQIVWERRATLGTLGGYFGGLLPLGILILFGLVFWKYARPMAHWLSRDPRSSKSQWTATAGTIETTRKG